jgi:2-polyprenyl-3-methyl-5-hydroxy-6-metoxy-1,4-benzoquinol methylase
MQPQYQKVDYCRVCKSKNIAGLGVDKKYYLMNLDETVNLSYSVCCDCQFIFQGEYVGDTYLDNYYKQSGMLRRKEPTKYEVDQNKRQAAFVERNVALEGLKVLEIGAHAGAFLQHLHQNHSCKTYYNELSEEANKVLAEQEGLIDFSSLPAGSKVDMIVLRHVLEHIFDLDSFIQYLSTLLNENGCLFIEVPDWSWLDGQTDPLIFEHLSQFSTHNLILLMKRHGWQAEALEKSLDDNDPATPNRVQRHIFKPSAIPKLHDKNIVQSFRDYYEDNYEYANTRISELIVKIGPEKTIALYPASHLTFTALNESNIKNANVVGMFDIDTKKHGKIVSSIPVKAAEELKRVQPDIILLFTMAYEKEIRESFAEMGLTAEVLSIAQLIKKEE